MLGKLGGLFEQTLGLGETFVGREIHLKGPGWKLGRMVGKETKFRYSSTTSPFLLSYIVLGGETGRIKGKKKKNPQSNKDRLQLPFMSDYRCKLNKHFPLQVTFGNGVLS